MSLEAILAAIHASGEAQIGELNARAEAQAQEILAQARLEAERLYTEARAATLPAAEKERARILQHARLEALKILGNTNAALIETAFQSIREHLTGARTRPDYPAVLRGLTEEALTELSGSLDEDEQARLEADPRDEALLESILRDLGQAVAVRDALDCWGGLIAESEDGRIMVINTLEARLERATPYLHHTLAALFEDQRSEG